MTAGTGAGAGASRDRPARHLVLVGEAGEPGDEGGFAALAAWLGRLGWTVHVVGHDAASGTGTSSDDVSGTGSGSGVVPSVAAVARVVAGLEGPVVLLGHGAGGAVVTRVAGHADGRVAVLVLLAADLGSDDAEGLDDATRCVYVETRRDEVVPLEVQREAERRLPGAMRLTVDTGHRPQTEMPEHLAGDLHAALTTELRHYVVRHDLRRI